MPAYRRPRPAVARNSSPVVRLAAQDAVGPVDLFEQDDARQAVGQGDAAEGEDPLGARPHRRREPVGPADGEAERDTAAVLLVRPDHLARDLVAAELLAALVEGDEARAGGERREERGVVAHLAQLDLRMVTHAREVVSLGLEPVLLLQPADREDRDLQ